MTVEEELLTRVDELLTRVDELLTRVRELLKRVDELLTTVRELLERRSSTETVFCGRRKKSNMFIIRENERLSSCKFFFLFF